MRVRFTKMHGAGNDFVMLDGISQKIALSAEKVRRLADRHFGVGCDQVLLVEAPRNPEADFRYRIFNHDGSEVENCGNGARCFAVFVRQRGLTCREEIRVETAGGLLTLKILEGNAVRVNMGVPQLEPSDIPFDAEIREPRYALETSQGTLDIHAVSMGNPHAVTVVVDLDRLDIHRLGPEIETHPRFPKRVNAGFLEIVDRHEGRLRVFERGVGETLACGTGACAAMVAGVLRGDFASEVVLHLRGGALRLEWEGEGKPVMMTGPTATVFQGQVRL